MTMKYIANHVSELSIEVLTNAKVILENQIVNGLNSMKCFEQENDMIGYEMMKKQVEEWQGYKFNIECYL